MPTLSQVHVDQALTDFSVAYMQDESNATAMQGAPPVGVGQQSNKYHIYSRADFHRTEAVPRGPNSRGATRTYNLSNDTFFCVPWTIGYNVSEQESANADAALDSEEDAAELLAQDLMIRHELQFSSAAFTAANWASSHRFTGGTNFTRFDDAASTPIETLRQDGNLTILQDSGKRANTLVLGAQTWISGLVDHPDILDRIKHTQRGVVTTDLVAGILEYDRVLVSYIVRNTAGEGATQSNEFVLGDDALVAYVDPSAGLRGATAMKTFVWSGLTGSVDGIRTKRYDVPQEDAYPRIETDFAFDIKVVSDVLGAHFDDCIS